MAPLSSLPALSLASGVPAGHLSVLRKRSRPLKISANGDACFPILYLAENGSKVSKGDLLWKADTHALDQKIKALQQKVISQQKRLNQEKRTWQQWLASTFANLERLQDLAVAKQEQAEHFRRTVSTERRDTARGAIRLANLILNHQVGEYRALFSLDKMRRATTSLSSRVLEHRQGSIAAAEFCVGMEALNHRKIIDRLLPRELNEFAQAAENTRRQYATALVICTRRMEVRAKRRASTVARFEQQCRELGELELHRSQSTLCAPANGRFFHHPELSESMDGLPSNQIIAFFQPE